MTDPVSSSPSPDPVAVAVEALALLRSGRPDAAQLVLEPLPAMIEEALGKAVKVALVAGFDAAEAEVTAALDELQGSPAPARETDG